MRERLDDVDADDVLLRHGCDVGELLLHVTKRWMRDVAVAIGQDDEHGSDRQSDQRELPLEHEQNGGDRHDRQHVLEEEDQPVAEEEPHALQIDGRARHELSGLVTVVEPERQAHEVGVEALPHVHFDRERLFAGDQPAPGHESRARESESDDQPEEQPQLVVVVRTECPVDHALRHPDQRDLRTLRRDGEEDRNDERDSVRSQESEQSDEGPAIRDRAHSRNLASRQLRELCANQSRGLRGQLSVRRRVEPSAGARRMGKWDHNRIVQLVAPADALCETGDLQ